MQPNSVDQPQASHQTVALALRAPESPVKQQMARLCRAAPPPLDCALLMSALVGAATAINVAVGGLQQPNGAALSEQDASRLLAEHCIRLYEASPGLIDAENALQGRIGEHQPWALARAVGELDNAALHPAAEAAGIELLLSLHHCKPMAAKFCAGARIALQSEELSGQSLQDLMSEYQGEALPHWLRHVKSRYAEFLALFEVVAPPPAPPRSFEDKANTELVSKAAFASYRRRAGILDDTCLSRRQISVACSFPSPGVFRNPAERRAALWLIGCSGLYTTSTQHIPLCTKSPVNWAVDYDLVNGILRRDLRCLAPDAARARPGVNSPSSFVAYTPAPEDVRDELLRCAELSSDPLDCGDLIPALRTIQPTDLLYPEIADLPPTFARWSRTLAPLALQVGIDALLGGIVTGDLGITARSKTHYCLIDTQEIWDAAGRLYEALGFSRPVPMPAGLMPFGSAVVPLESTLRRIDDDLCQKLEGMRPPNRLSNVADLLKFHDAYVRTLAWRIAVWLCLREAAELPLRAYIDERFDLCIDLVEKSSHGRVGGMPAAICEELRAALGNYRNHCAAMYARLRTFGWSNDATAWLDAVTKRADVPLLCTIDRKGRFSPLGTKDLRTNLEGLADLAVDYGRKFTENYLRRAAVLTQDIDRQMRHDVLGQEQETSIADSSELEWVRRVEPVLSEMSSTLFRRRLDGLRKGSAAS